MPTTFILAASLLLHLALCVETIFIVFLLLLFARVIVVIERRTDQRDQARRERDEAKKVIAAIRRMGEIRVETIARMRECSQ